MYTDFSLHIKMNKERIKLIVKNMDLLVRALKDELDDTKPHYEENYQIDDYDEVFED
jgi:aerobic-type carbon monoxide dehydrogenase small subunit (CoxS/CutS family)